MQKEKLKIVRLQGGVGNQMFQYAFGKALEHRLGQKVLFDKLDFDKERLTIVGNTNKNKDGICIRQYELGIFNPEIEFATQEQIDKAKGKELKIKSKLRNYIIKLTDKEKYKHYKIKAGIITEKSMFSYSDVFFEDFDSVYYDGYFQNEKFFKEISPFLKKTFILPPIRENDTYNKDLFDKVTNTPNSVFVHVRRDDYLTLGCELNNDYYQKAAKYIADRTDNPHFYVFCAEDTDYIKNGFDLGFPFELIGEKNKTAETYYENMRLMMACKHSIIANSSYSWWAAWLSFYEGKIVTAPSPWSADKDEIICPEWIKIEK